MSYHTIIVGWRVVSQYAVNITRSGAVIGCSKWWRQNTWEIRAIICGSYSQWISIVNSVVIVLNIKRFAKIQEALNHELGYHIQRIKKVSQIWAPCHEVTLGDLQSELFTTMPPGQRLMIRSNSLQVIELKLISWPFPALGEEVFLRRWVFPAMHQSSGPWPGERNREKRQRKGMEMIRSGILNQLGWISSELENLVGFTSDRRLYTKAGVICIRYIFSEQ